MEIETLFTDLPMDGRIWRVEWFGQLRQNFRSPQELEIDVVFRRIGIARPTVSDQLRTIRIGIGALCRVPMGSLWRDGVYVGDFEVDTLKSSIHSHKAKSLFVAVKTLRAPSTPSEGHYFGSHLIPKKLGKERVHILDFPAKANGRRAKQWKLMIPLAEIARAWFLRDSELALLLLSQPINEAVKLLFDASKSMLDRYGRSRLVVSPGVTPGSVVTVAMLALDPMSRVCAGRMVDQLVTAATSKSTCGLEALIPVVGDFPLHAKGEWGIDSGVRTFFVYQLTGIPLPELGEIEWLRSEGANGSASGASSFLEPSEAAKESAIEIRLKVMHNLVPSSGLSRSLRFENVAVHLNPPFVSRIRIDGEKDDQDQTIKSPKPNTFTELETCVSTGVGMSYEKDLPSIRFKSQARDDSEDQESPFLEAGLDKIERLGRALELQQGFRVGMVCGANQVQSLNGTALTQLAADISWALIAQRPRHAICVEVKFEDRFHYVIEVERRFKKEEISSCLLGRLKGKRLSSSDIDRVLRAFAEARGSWNTVHDPFWRRPLAHKFKNEKTFAQKIASLIRRKDACMLLPT